MRIISNNKRKGIALLIIIVLILTIIVSVCRIQPETEAQNISTSTIKVTYLPGNGGTITVAEASAAEITYVEALSAIKSTKSNVEEYTISEEDNIAEESISNENLDNEEKQEIDEEEELENTNPTENDTTINESSENNIPNEDVNTLDNEIDSTDEINTTNEENETEETDEELMLMSAEDNSSTVTSVTITHEVKAQQTCGEYDYTDGKIVLMENGDNGITFNGGKRRGWVNTLNKSLEYEYVLTGYKLVSVTKSDGTVISNFEEPTNQNYADKTNAAKDIGTIYAQNGWYIVPDDVVEITVEAVYGRAVYVRSPYDKMYYDYYHIFYYGENNDGTSSLNGTAKEKSSDNNTGTSPDDAVSTLKRAYDLIDADTTKTTYDNVVVLCGDFYEVSYNDAGKSYVTGTAGTYKNYNTKNFGYITSTNKPMTITSEYGKKYNFIYASPSWDTDNWSSLRLDNVTLYSLRTSDIELKPGQNGAKDKYPMARQFNFGVSGERYFEATENLKTPNEWVEIRFGNSKYFRINGGRWRVVHQYANKEWTSRPWTLCLLWRIKLV